MVGIVRERTFAVTVADLVAAWLSERLGHGFVERRRGDDGNLASEVLHDELEGLFRGKAMIGMIELEGGAADSALPNPGLLQSFTDAGSIAFKRQGLAHAFCNEATGLIQVTFDHLPGELEFVSARSAKPSRGAMPAHAEITTWYGFGEVDDGSCASMARLRSMIGHGTVNSELKIELA